LSETRPAARRTIGITGALGFVASHLMPRLLARGDRVVGIVRPRRDAARLVAMGVEVRQANLLDPATFGRAFDKLEGLVHLSGMAQVPGFIAAVERAGVKRGVFVGSTGVYTKLESSGADSKRRGEAALRTSSIAYVILRPTMIYGTTADRNLVRLLRWLRNVPIVPVPGGGATPQQPVHVEDLVDAILAGLDRPEAARREYDIGGPEALPLRDVIRQSATAMGRRVLILPIPLMPAYHAVKIMRGLRLPCPVRGEQVLRLAESKAVDIGPAAADLEFRPRTFKEGIGVEAEMVRGSRR
jgi:uncharacterized protein YbjT (DUF2867 family)